MLGLAISILVSYRVLVKLVAHLLMEFGHFEPWDCIILFVRNYWYPIANNMKEIDEHVRVQITFLILAEM